MDYKRNEKYFKKAGPLGDRVGIAAIVVGVLWLLLPGSEKVWGLLLAAGGGALIYLQISGKLPGKPSDSEIDQACQNEIANVVQKALSKLGVDEDEAKLIEPIVIHGYYYKNISSPVLYKAGKDGRWRSSNYEAAVFLFSESHVHAYKYRFSLISPEKNEATDEYFYKDIVTVSTSSDSITFQDTTKKKKSHTFNFEEFKLTTSGGTSITCSLWDPGHVERSIQGMRQLIKQRKTS